MTPMPRPTAPTLLFVEDDERVRRIAQRALARLGQVVGVASVAEARASLTTAQQQDTLPRMVITDLQVGDESGIALAYWMRAHPALAAIPRICWSGYDSTTVVQQIAAQRGVVVQVVLAAPRQPFPADIPALCDSTGVFALIVSKTVNLVQLGLLMARL